MTRLIPTRQTWLLILVAFVIGLLGTLDYETKKDTADQERIHAQGGLR